MKIYQTFLVILVFIKIGLSQTLDRPESIIYDSAHSRYLVSNTGSGEIIAYSDSGEFSSFNNTASQSIRGIAFYQNILFAAGDEGVMGFDLESGNVTVTVPIPEANFLNDVAIDSSGSVYVSDGPDIYKVLPDVPSYEVFTSGLNDSNGLLYSDSSDGLIVTQEIVGGGAKLSMIDILSKAVTDLMTTDFQYLDGLAQSPYGSYYVSSWSTHSVYEIDPAFTNATLLFSSTDCGPADISYDAVHHVLAIPQMNNNELKFVDMPYIKVTSPNGGEVFETGETINIQWESRYVTTVEVAKSTDGGETFEKIADDIPGDSALTHEIPPSWTHGPVMIRVQSKSHPNIHDESDSSFTVVAPTGIEGEEIVTDFRLEQNYPNPFNPSTTIRYTIPAGTRHAVSVQLLVYDILGNEIAILVSEQQSPGSYERTWNLSDRQAGAKNVSSGVYLYMLRCGEYIQCRKMLLLK